MVVSIPPFSAGTMSMIGIRANGVAGVSRHPGFYAFPGWSRKNRA